MTVQAGIGVIGGSGFYEFLDDVTELTVDTPYGLPSAPLTVAEVGPKRVAFLPRHGRGHEYPPHRVNYRANLWALRSVGVRQVIGPCAAGSLRAELRRGDFVLLDQLVDRTWGRPDTFFDGPLVRHTTFADPYCPALSAHLVATARSQPEVNVHPVGTVVVVQGPRFSTRAESAWFRQQGWEVVNMTQYPEAYLARELGLCYAGLALVTDYDTGEAGGGHPVASAPEPVTMEAVMDVLRDNVAKTRSLLLAAIPTLAPPSDCACRQAVADGPFG